jgi:hypothetical protein
MSETNLEESAKIMFTALNAVHALHAPAEAKIEDQDSEKCVHCSLIAGRIVQYPCPTAHLLLRDMVVENEETPSE